MSGKARSTGRRLLALDGLRGLAACAVVFYHSILHNDLSLLNRVLYQPLQAAGNTRDFVTKLALILLNGEVAVFVFFVLSGCVLRLSLENKRDEPVLSLCPRFIGARVARLYPPLIVCMVLFYIMGKLHIGGFPDFSHMQLMQNASLWAITMSGPTETVQAEVMAVPFILVAWVLRRQFGVVALALTFFYAVLAIESPSMVFGLFMMNAYLFAFIAGMLVAEPMLKPVIEQAHPATWWAAFWGLILCRTFAPHAALTSLIAMVLAASLLVAGLLHGRRGSLVAFLEYPIIHALGRISFSFYLLNVPVLNLIWAFTDRMAWPKHHALEAGLATGVLAVAMTWPLAWASERWVERPSIAASRWVWSAFRRPVSLVPSAVEAD